MQFSTPVPIIKSNCLIDYNSKILSLGSCFAENMADKFEYFKFQNDVNPFGIIFNAVSIERIVERIVNQELFTEKDIFFHNESWHCFEVHSCLSSSDKSIFLENLNQILQKARTQIFELSHCIITYGTSWVYRNIETNQIVANCHKMSQNEFYKEILSIEIIQKSIENTIQLIQKINPSCNFIFTISPVRHIKDGFIENQISKSHLIAALHLAIVKLLNSNYFPSYEIIMDELRDYRFYKQDMLHPNQTAIDYVWIKFSEKYISETEFATMNLVGNIQKMIAHKTLNPYSIKNQEFKIKIQEKIKQIQLQNPQIIF